ncbi:hypothetical protein [Pontibacter mucosus]|nr:hypothetical protein [Pontibacter mucosus]
MDAERQKFIGRISTGNEVVIEPWDGFTYPTLQDFTHYAIITDPKD